MTTVEIRRLETFTDEKGRNAYIATEVFSVSGSETSEVLENFINKLQSEGTDDIHYDVISSEHHAFEVYGTVVLGYLKLLADNSVMSQEEINNTWAEDNISYEGKIFDTEEMIYSIEIY